MLSVIFKWYDLANENIDKIYNFNTLEKLLVNERIGHFKYIKEEDVLKESEEITKLITDEFQSLKKEVNYL